MKKQICFLFTALSALIMGAQTAPAEDWLTYFRCDFNDGIPSDFATYDRDGKTLYFTMVQAGLIQGKSWAAVREEKTDPVNYYAGSGSKHKYAADEEHVAADDWMVTPQIWIKGGNAKLTWRSKSIGENKKNSSYNVYVSTIGNTPDDFGSPIYTVTDESVSSWTKHELSLAEYKGQRVYVAFQNISFDKEILAIDDILAEGQKGLCELLVTTPEYIFGKDAATISANITAYSDEEINSFTAYYEYKGKVTSQTYSGLSLKNMGSYDFSFDEKIPIALGDTIDYKVWAEVNSITLDVIEQRSISFLFEPKRKIVVEEGTGMWCVYCPEGIVAMEELAKKYPDSFIGIVVHYDDPLEVHHYWEDLYFPRYPSAYINRKYTSEDVMKEVFDGFDIVYTMLNGGIETYYLDALDDQTYADVSLQSSSDGKTFNAVVKSRFAINIADADYKIALVVIENDVTGEGFYQDNGYWNSDTPMGGYESLPERILDPTFQEVAREVYDDYMGIPGSVPTTIVAGETYEFEFSAPIPENVNSVANTKIIAMLIDQKTGEIMNADIVTPELAGVNDILAEGSLELSYRLENGRCSVDFTPKSMGTATVSMYSVNGTLLHKSTVETIGSKTTHSINVNGLSGIYFITVNQDGKTDSAKLAL